MHQCTGGVQLLCVYAVNSRCLFSSACTLLSAHVLNVREFAAIWFPREHIEGLVVGFPVSTTA